MLLHKLPPPCSAPPAKEILASPVLLGLLTACPSLACHRGILCLDPPGSPGHLQFSHGAGHFNLELMGTCLWTLSPHVVCCGDTAWCTGTREDAHLVHNLVLLGLCRAAAPNCISLCHYPRTPALKVSLSALDWNVKSFFERVL